MSVKPLLTVKNLVKHFESRKHIFHRSAGKVHAVNEVSFELRSGETLGLVGESGCGKSTLGKAILRLIEPNSGSIHFDDKDVLAMGPEALRKLRRDMQIVFQDPFSSLNPRMTVGRILSEPFEIHQRFTRAELKAEIARLLSVVGLDPSADSRFPHEFSGGQRQRIGIARAVALRPKLIIADEPVSALDVSIQSQILNLFKDLKRDFGLSYVFVSHDLAVIEHISDTVAVMYLGRIVEYGPAERIFESPRHPYTIGLMASVPKFGRKVAANKGTIEGDVPSPMSPPSGCHFHPRCQFATDVCREKPPALSARDSRAMHQVACHHA